MAEEDNGTADTEEHDILAGFYRGDLTSHADADRGMVIAREAVHRASKQTQTEVCATERDFGLAHTPERKR